MALGPKQLLLQYFLQRVCREQLLSTGARGEGWGWGGIGREKGLVTQARLIIAPLQKAAGVRLHYCPYRGSWGLGHQRISIKEVSVWG